MTSRHSSNRGPGRPPVPKRRADLLAIGRRAFAASGWSGTSMSHLAEAAGLSKASLFHHFPTKESYYLEVMAGIMADLQRLIGGAELVNGSFAERLDDIGTLVTEYFGRHPEVAQLILRDVVGGGPYAQGPGAIQIQDTLDLAVRFLEAGVAAGELHVANPRQTVLTLVGLHLFHFAAAEVSGAFLSAGVFDEAGIALRRAAVIQQMRLLCGA